MEKNNLQTTVKQLEEFLSAYYRKTGVRPTLGEALDMMEKDNLLSAPPAVAAADSKVQHTVEEICEIIDSQPVNATAFLQNTSRRSPARLMFPARTRSLRPAVMLP